MSRVDARRAELAGLPRVRRQFEAWRTRKGSGESIPRSPWQSAAALARRHGAGRIALALGLDSHNSSRSAWDAGRGESRSAVG